MNRNKLLRIARNMYRIYSRRRIATAAAALSYFLTLSLFPLLICLYFMLGHLFPADRELLRFLDGLLPAETIRTILEYLRYVSSHRSSAMLVMALSVLATSSSAAFRTVNRVMGEMRGVGRFPGFLSLPASFLFSLVFLASFYASALLLLTGKRFLEFADRHIMFMNISDRWQVWRFGLLFLLLFVLLCGLYRFTAPKGRPVRLLPGAALASLALVAVSILFSLFIGAGTRYPLIYGSLASIILMMLWLYSCGVILFLGNALNVSLEQIADGRM